MSDLGRDLRVGILSARAAAISTPIFFVATGVIMAQGLELVRLELNPHLIKGVAEGTLTWVCVVR